MFLGTAELGTKKMATVTSGLLTVVKTGID